MVESLKLNVRKALGTTRLFETRQRQITVKMLKIFISRFVVLLAAAVAFSMSFSHVFFKFFSRAEYLIWAEFAAPLARKMIFQFLPCKEAVRSLAFLASQIRAQKIVLALVMDISFFLSFENNFAVVARILKQVEKGTLANVDYFYRNFIEFQNGLQFFVPGFVSAYNMSPVLCMNMALRPKSTVVVCTVARRVRVKMQHVR